MVGEREVVFWDSRKYRPLAYYCRPLPWERVDDQLVLIQDGLSSMFLIGDIRLKKSIVP